MILDRFEKPIGEPSVPDMAMAIVPGHNETHVFLRVAPTRKPTCQADLQAIQNMVQNGMATGYQLTPDGAREVAKGLVRSALEVDLRQKQVDGNASRNVVKPKDGEELC